MKTSIRELSETEIQKRLQEARQELFTLRLQRASGKLTTPARVALTRRTVARLLTALRAQAPRQVRGEGRE